MNGPGAQLEAGVTYWPASVGPYLWQEFQPALLERDLTAIAGLRLRVVRVLLSWDAFMPTDRRPNPRRMRDLETLLDQARALELRVVPVLFAQSVGDCVLLPAYAIDRRAPRRGVRCITDGRLADGGPRDIYADPLLLEVQVRWLDAMLAAFAGHPAVAAWDLGHDPASTVRPRRIAEMVGWARLLGERVRAQHEQCRLTLGQDDLLLGRAVRPAALASHVDVLGLALRPQRLPFRPGAPDVNGAVFVTALAQALSGGRVPLMVEVGMASAGELDDEDVETATRAAGAMAERVDDEAIPTVAAGESARAADRLLRRLAEGGVAGMHAAAWSDWGPRTLAAPPADRRSWLARLGIVDVRGEVKALARAWTELAAREEAVSPAAPYPSGLDADAYYAHLPDSLRELHARWEGDGAGTPAILE